MKNKKKVIKRFIDKINEKRTAVIYVKECYSLGGEDILINNLLADVQLGHYLDVGAHHPFRFSNTFKLYKKGWRGINIDASAKAIELFNNYRPEDININVAISDFDGTADFYNDNFGAMNTLDYSRKRQGQTSEKVVVKKISSVINELNLKGLDIKFLNIDIEGHDFKALKFFPWDKFRPKLICLEDLEFDPLNPSRSECLKYLTEIGYNLVAHIPKTLFFETNGF